MNDIVKNVEVTAWVRRETREEFFKRYKGFFSRFVRNAMERAVCEEEFFKEMCFGEPVRKE